MRFVLAFSFCVSVFAGSPSALLDTAPIRFESRPDGWIARGLNHSLAFTDRAAVLRLGRRTITMSFPGSNRRASFSGTDPAVATNYFTGKQAMSVPSFRRLHRAAVYPGIDVVYYGNGGELEYDFEIAPGANPSAIRMRFDGADRIALNERGEIVLTLGDGEIVQRRPVVYQKRASGEVVSIESSYRIGKRGEVRVELGSYDRAAPLVVDPALAFTAYLEGSSTDIALAVAHDANGNIYLAGNTWSPDFPVSGDAYQSAYGTAQDVWVMKLNPTGGANAIVYCSYLGGGAAEALRAMTVDSNGVIYLTGSTTSANYPISSGAFQSTISTNSHAFVTMLDPTQGSSGLIYSTFIGGANFEEGDAIAVAGGKIYVAGFTTSDNFPTVNPVQAGRTAGYDAFVSQFDPSQSGAASLIFSTYLGGSGQDLPHAIAVDPAGNIYVGGVTYSTDFPTTPVAYQPFYKGDGDGFVTKLNPSTATVGYSTLLGGSLTDDIKRIVVEPNGHIAVTGYTQSSDFPSTQGAFQTSLIGIQNAFLTVLDPAGNSPLVQGLVYSTFFGGSGGEVALDMRRDPAGRYIIGGYTYSVDLPVSSNAISSSSSAFGPDGFVAILDPTKPAAQQRVYASYVTGPGFQVVYGVDADASGNYYAAGFSTSNLFPTAVQNPNVGKMSAFVFTFTLK